MEGYFNICSDLVFWTLMSGLREEDEQLGQRNVDERSNKLRLGVCLGGVAPIRRDHLCTGQSWSVGSVPPLPCETSHASHVQIIW